MKKLLLTLITITFSISLLAQQKVVIRFEKPGEKTVKQFTQPEYDVAAYKPGEFLDVVVFENEYERILASGYPVEIVQTEAGMAANLGNVDDINGYRTYTEALAELQQIEADHPDICKLYDLGDSRGKEYFNSGYGNYGDYQHDVWALKLSDNVELEEDEPAIYYMGAHHAREPLSTEVAFYVLNYLLDNYGSDPEVTENVNSKEIWFIPIVNPDGHEVVLDQIDLNWRKNIRDNDGNGSITSGSWLYPDGVDPNRNYGWEWGGQGASASPSDQTYRGPEAFSEPEIIAMRDLMDDHHFVAGITYHTYSELVLWPYGYTSSAVAPDVDAISDLGTMMGEAIPSLYGGHYTPQPSWALYPASGVTDDYAYGQHGIFSYTIELATEFIPPANVVEQVTEDNLEAALILLNRPNYATLTGHVTDAATSEPLVAEIYIEEIDNSGSYREPYQSNEEYGSYYRMLMPGTYTVTFSAFGYISQTFENIEITDSEQTILDAELVESEVISVTGTVTDSDTGEPIEGASVEVMNTPVDPVTTNENGEYTIEEIYENTYDFKVFALDYATVIQTVSVSPQNNVVDFELTETNAVSFETGIFGEGWNFGGNADWTIDNTNAWDGAYSAKSGNIGDNQSTSLMYSMEVASAGLISFYRKVSSEAGYDYLQFYIDNQLQDEWAGELDWEEVSYNVSAGNHTFKWVYEKDVYVSNGDDCGWIDFVIFPPSATVNAQAGNDATICEGEDFQCDGNAVYYNTLEWSTSGDGTFSDPAILNPVYTPGTEDISATQATLTLTAFDDDGNEDSDNLILTIDPLPGAGTDITGPDEVCAGNAENYSCEIIANATAYEWHIEPMEAGYIESQNENEIVVSWNDDFFDEASIQVRGINDCGFGDMSPEFIVTVEDCTGLEEIKPEPFSIYPNPAGDQIMVNLNSSGQHILNITIFDTNGRERINKITAEKNNPLKIDLTSLSNGVYFIRLVTGDNQYSKKFVIR